MLILYLPIILVEGQEENRITSTWPNTPVTLDGQITKPSEWPDATYTEIDLGTGDPIGPPYISARVWAMNDDEWLYLLYRIRWPTDRMHPDDGVSVYGYWGPYENPWYYFDAGSLEYTGWPWDTYRHNETEQRDDALATPPGETNIEGAATHDGTYYWFELRKELSSGDGYDWDLEPGRTYGLGDRTPEVGGTMFVAFWEGSESLDYYQQIQLSLASPEPARLHVSDMIVSPKQGEAGKPVSMSVNVTNVGDLSGELTVKLEINGVEVDAKYVVIDSGESEIVEFEVTRDEPGHYSVQVAGYYGEFSLTSAEDTTAGGVFGNLELRDVYYTISIIGALVGVGG